MNAGLSTLPVVLEGLQFSDFMHKKFCNVYFRHRQSPVFTLTSLFASSTLGIYLMNGSGGQKSRSDEVFE